MSAGNTTENDILKLMFNSVALAWAGDATLEFALHSADPGEAGTASTNEISYTGYARVSKTRADASKFTVSGNTVTNADTITFPKRTNSGTVQATHWSLCRPGGGAAQIIIYGALNDPLDIGINVQPLFEAGQLSASLN